MPSKSMPASFVRYLLFTTLVITTAGLARAQTSPNSLNKGKVEAGSAPAASAQVATELGDADANPAVPTAIHVPNTTPGADATTIKSEGELSVNADPLNSPPTGTAMQPAPPAPCKRRITADVVALSQPFMLNRLGAAMPNGMIFALRRDTVGNGNQIQLRPGKRARPLVLRANVGDCLKIIFTNSIPDDKFKSPPPPATASGDTSEVSLHVQGMEWVTGSKDDGSFVGKNNSSLASSSPVGPDMPPNVQTYTLFAKAEGTFLLYTMGDTSSIGSQLTNGLFGALNVEPSGAEWYRSQVSADDLLLATYNANRPEQVPPGSLLCPVPGSPNCTFTVNGKSIKVLKTPDFGSGPGLIRGGYLNTLDNHPLIDYGSVYPAKRADGSTVPPDMVGTPILRILDGTSNIVHSDLTAMITGPNAGRFPGAIGDPNKPEPPCNAENNGAPPPGGKVDPLFCRNPASPDRKQPYRELTIIYHGALGGGLDGSPGVASQAFPVFNDQSSILWQTLVAGQDSFAINYGTGGIGAEVYANRIGVGPMGDCVDCKFEEFFLSAWSVGDPAMLVDNPANSNDLAANPKFQSPCKTTADFNSTACAGAKTPASGTPYTMAPKAKATVAFFPDDPSNVYHSYINDHVKFRILHGGRDVTHVHHQHAHQWLQSPNSDQGSYLDSQMISPGASYTLEMVYNGSGNRNKVVGDSIFHCHFYPHFAAGMWAMWRTHDVFEAGTFVYPEGTTINATDVSGQVVPGSRALPDGEIKAGTPNPALVPLPTLPMAPLPAYAQIQNGVTFEGVPITVGGQIVLGGKCVAGKVNGLDVIGGCPVVPPGDNLNGTVINSQYDPVLKTMVGQFLPSTGNQLQNPGFPFFIPGIAGARAPHPPFDFAPDGAGGFMDGGLARHVVAGGSIAFESHDTIDWSKDLDTMKAIKLAEDGTAVEKAAIAYFSNKCYPTFFPDGTPGSCPSSTSTPPTGFRLNGLPRGPQRGAPFADPAVDDNGNAVNVDPATGKQNLRTYKAAAIQLDVTLNKKGWHYPQQRILTLWKDVRPTLDYVSPFSWAFDPANPQTGGRPPEPLFFRGNSGDIVEYWHTNLVPNYYLVDDFQVRTPTDILGQHIHLVKFDVTSSDGAGNGFNYEDGTFSPEEVQEIIKAINKSTDKGFANFPNQLLLAPDDPSFKLKHGPPKDIFDCSLPANAAALRCQPCTHPTPANPQCISWLGAQTTIQRWYLDSLEDDAGVDRTLRTVFTHDHFGPSTHQQAGLYAGLVVEPKGSTWTTNDGVALNTQTDGGPTSWQARILTRNAAESYREFLLEFQDLQLAYQTRYPPIVTGPNPDKRIGWMNKRNAINPPGTPSLVTTGIPALPAGTQSVNYTNEPIATRLGRAVDFPVPAFPRKLTDLSYVFDNSIQPTVNPLISPARPWYKADPLTPLMRAYQNDNVQVRVLVGAHVFAHQFNFQGPTWFAEPSWKNSGYRSAQPMGLSEHFEFLFKVPSSSAPKTNRKCPDKMSDVNCVDYLYSPSFDESGLANGLWGLFRSYDPTAKTGDPIRKMVVPLPNNPIGPTANVTYATCPANLASVKCVPGSGTPCNRVFNITAVTSEKALRSPAPPAPPRRFPTTIVFNDRGESDKVLTNPLGLLYVRTEDLVNNPGDPNNGILKPGVPVEPLILRANAGDCIEVNLTNGIAENSKVFNQNFNLPPPLNNLPPPEPPLYPHKASSFVGLHPQLLSYDGAKASGVNVGWNTEGQPSADQVVPVGGTVKYQWYAGKIERAANGSLSYTPVEFGSLNLFPSDPMFQNINGLFGSMIIEPRGSTWKCGEPGSLVGCDPPADPPAGPYALRPSTRAAATATLTNQTKFREFALMISDTIRMNDNNSSAVNYRTEPWNFRYADNPTLDFSCMLSNQLTQVLPAPSTPIGDPKTPILNAQVGDKVRFRMTHPFGTGTSQVFSLHGHAWQRNPYQNNSRVIGSNNLSQWLGSRDNHGSSDHFDLVIDKAGGESGQAGDYLYTAFVPTQARDGAWGLFRVRGNGPLDPVRPNAACRVQTTRPGYVPAPPKDAVDSFVRKPLNPGNQP